MTSTSPRVRTSAPLHVCGRHCRLRLVRTTRARIIRLRNDYKALMTKIEVGLHAHHAAMKDPNSLLASTSTSSITASMNTGSENHIATEPSFARIGGVASGSPAENAGLKIGDKVRRFGNVNWMNHEKLSKVAEIVQRHEGVCALFYSHSMAMFANGCLSSK